MNFLLFNFLRLTGLKWAVMKIQTNDIKDNKGGGRDSTGNKVLALHVGDPWLETPAPHTVPQTPPGPLLDTEKSTQHP